MSDEDMFGGQPVIKFHREADRRNFLRYAGLVGVGAAFVASGTLAGNAPASASQRARAAQQDFGEGDIGILNYALTLEYLEFKFYQMGLSKGLLTGRDLELLKPIESHEGAHVQAVMQTVTKLGGTPVDEPQLQFPDKTFSSADQFLATAVKFEELGVDAYHGQITKIQSGEVLKAAAAIAGVESRHAAILEDLTGGTPFPAPVEDRKSMSEVLPKVKPFLA